jgi:aminoglycoside phosphotransferase
LNDRVLPAPALHQVAPVPHGRTARRLEWQHLPPAVRALVEARLGAPVVRAESQGTGFTPGFASRLVAADGSALFVKAASKQAQRPVAAAYAEEGRVQRLLPDDLPAPRLLWTHEDDRWVVIGWEAVAGAAPRRPWQPDELDSCLATLERVHRVTTPLPPGLELKPLHEELPTLLSGWDHVVSTRPEWPHLAEARSLARSYATLPDAGHLVHADARDDNFIVAPDRGALLCDWNWPGLGPRWLDVVTLLVTAHGDGLDADALLADHPLAAGVDAAHVDAWLAALCGLMVEADSRPTPASSPHLGTHRRWWAAATWSWLARRRGWPAGGGASTVYHGMQES